MRKFVVKNPDTGELAVVEEFADVSGGWAPPAEWGNPHVNLVGVLHDAPSALSGCLMAVVRTPAGGEPLPTPAAPSGKDTNPKDRLAANKLPLSLVPDTMVATACLAFVEGAAKYGAYNWRVKGVLMSVYLDAMMRHLAALKNGEDADPATNVPHLASLLACAAIIADAGLCGKLTDDRPPAAPVGPFIRDCEAQVKAIKALHADKSPKHYTIADKA